MTASMLIRHGVACTLGLSAWWYFNSVGNIFYPQWIGVIVAAFVITLVVVIISNNVFAALIIVALYLIAFKPNIYLAMKDILPIAGGTIAGVSLWKIL